MLKWQWQYLVSWPGSCRNWRARQLISSDCHFTSICCLGLVSSISISISQQKMHRISRINWCRRKALTIWQGSLVIGRFPPCDNYLTQRCQLVSTWCQSAYKMGDDIYLLGSSSPLVVSIILSVCPSLINRCPPWATKLLTNPTLACRHFSIHMNVAVEVIWSGSATGRIVYILISNHRRSD